MVSAISDEATRVVHDIDRIILVPVIHTDSESVSRVREIIKLERPEVVAVELDHQRYQDLVGGSREGDNGTPTGDGVLDLVRQLASLELSIGDATGSDVGAEMLAAIEEGRAIGARIALVDRPLSATMNALSRIPLDEIYGFLDIAAGTATSLQVEEAREMVASLKDKQTLADVMAEFRREFPSLCGVLIDDRDRYVATALLHILDDVSGRIVAVLGAGHVDGVRTHLEEQLGLRDSAP